MKQNIDLLLLITKKTGLYGKARITTTGLARETPQSQQTISRRLMILEKRGYIKRVSSTGGIIITLTDKTRKGLEEAYEIFKTLFEIPESITGKLIAGFGQGKFYMSQKGYINQFEEKMGIKPYPGTLNLKIKIEELKQFLHPRKEIKIEGFDTDERSFGKIKAYKTTIEGKKAAILIPERSSHPDDIIEIVAEFNIREKLGLKDEDRVKVK